MKDLMLSIEGMSCGHCLNAVNKALSKISGVQVDSVQMGRAQLRYDEALISPEAITGAIRDAGYAAISHG
jgi:copper chaperone